MNLPALLNPADDVGLVGNVLFSRRAAGKFNQSEAAQIRRFVIGREGSSEQGLVVERLQIVEVRRPALVPQSRRIRLVVHQNGKMHGAPRQS